jgi:hypothetical protein
MQFQMDIQQKLERDFGSQLMLARDEIEALYIKTNWRVSNQIVRSVVYLSKGDFDSLNKNIERVLSDYKDLLWEAEYDRGDEKLRDFNLSFEALGLE